MRCIMPAGTWLRTWRRGKSQARNLRQRRIFTGIILLIALVLVGLYALQQQSGFSPDALRRWFADFGPWAPLVYVLVYLLAGLVFVPATPLTIAGGFLFGPLLGTLYALLAAAASAGVGFLLTRHVLPDLARRYGGQRVARVLAGVEAEGWRLVAFVRLVPLLPFSLVNYGLGLTRLGFGAYLVTTAICMLPGTAAYAWLGDAGAAALGGEGTVRLLLIGLAVVAALLFLPRWLRRFWQPGSPHRDAETVKARKGHRNTKRP